MRRALLVLLGVLALTLLPAAPAGAHPLGNFTVNTADRLVVTADGVAVTHVVDLAEIPTVQLAQSRAGVDTDDDGELSPAELGEYAESECARVAPQLTLRVDGERVPLSVLSADAAAQPGTAGLPTTRLVCELLGAQRPSESVSFEDPVALERNGWREVTAASRCGALTASTVPADSPSRLLTDYPEDLLASPVDVSTASLEVRAGAPCAAGGSSSVLSQDEVAPRGLDTLSQRFTDLVNRPDLTLPFAVLSVAAAVLFGVLHALAPGHGKTVMAAYLVGQRGTPRQALQLGALVTFTHTASVLALGAVLAVGALAAPELVVPVTEVVSGVLLAAVGVYLLVLAARRLRSGQPLHDHLHSAHAHGEHGDDHHGTHDHGHGAHSHDEHHDHDHHGHGAHGHDEHHEHEHGAHTHDEHHDHDHEHHEHHEHHELRRHERVPAPPVLVPAADHGVAIATPPLVHSHGGRAHTHAPLPDGPLSWRALAGMGVAGGLVPSPSALLVLLSANALGRPLFGALLVVAYGVGMAVTLTAAGLLLLRARAALDRRGWSAGRGAGLVRLLPLSTAAVVVLVGVALVLRGIASGRGLS